MNNKVLIYIDGDPLLVTEVQRNITISGAERSPGYAFNDKPGPLDIDPDLLNPILGDAYRLFMPLAPEVINVESDDSIEVQGNMDTPLACGLLELMDLDERAIVDIVYFYAQTKDMISFEDNEYNRAFKLRIKDVVSEGMEKAKELPLKV